MLPKIGTNEKLVEYRARLLSFVQERSHAPDAVQPSDGGCWYCFSDAHLDAFSMEFDTYVHRECVEAWGRANPQDEEMRIIATELNLGMVG